MAADGNLNITPGIPAIDRADGSLQYALNQLFTLAGFDPNTDVRYDDFASAVCHQYAVILYPIEYCCVFPNPGPSDGGPPPSDQIPDLLDQLEPIIDDFQIVPVEEDDLIVVKDIRCYPEVDIPLEDLGAYAIGPEGTGIEPEAPPNPTALIGMPDPYEQFDQVHASYQDALTRNMLPSSANSQNSAATQGSGPISQLRVNSPNATSPSTAQRIADTLRLRSQVEYPITIWTSPKYLYLNLNDVIRIHHLLATTTARIVAKEIGADWVVRFDCVICARAAHWPFEFFATQGQWPVPSDDELENDIQWGTAGDDTLVFYTGDPPPGVTPGPEDGWSGFPPLPDAPA